MSFASSSAGKRALVSVMVSVIGLALSGCTPPPYFPPRSPGIQDAPAEGTHQTGFFRGEGGVRLYEQGFRPKGQAKAAIVMVHGLKDHSDRYAEIASKLVSRGYAVYAFDLRGHGHSEGRRVYIDSFDEYLADLDIFMARVRAREPGLPLFLFGHSMGGAIATLYTETRNPHLAGLALSGAALKVGPGTPAPVIAITGFLGDNCPEAGVFDLDPKGFSRDPAVLAANESDPLVYQKPAAASTATALLGAIAKIQEQMENVTVPILVMHGGADRITDPNGSRDLVRRAHSTDKTLKIYDGLYHDILHEPEKDKVSADLAAWLDAHAK